MTKGSPTAPQSPSILRKLQALGRSVFYRRIRASWPAKLLDFPADLGTILFLLITIVFFTALVFAVKPYYREQIGYGSPPIAIRCGLMAFACVPILVALTGKANVLTFFTGISHERLNLLHRWVAWISFALSLFHTLPFLVGSARNPIVGGEAMVKTQFYMYGTSGANEVFQASLLLRCHSLTSFSTLVYHRWQSFLESAYSLCHTSDSDSTNPSTLYTSCSLLLISASCSGIRPTLWTPGPTSGPRSRFGGRPAWSGCSGRLNRLASATPGLAATQQP